MTIQETVDELTKDCSDKELVQLTEMMYRNARAMISNGCGDPDLIRACNLARIEIKKCKQLGIGV